MRKAVTFILAVCTLLFAFPTLSFAEREDISSQSTVLICADTGDVLYEDNADEKMLIASLTKIMTAILIIENCELDRLVIVKPDWCYIEGSSMYLKAGKMYSVNDLLYGMMLTSGNDAATALACHCSGDVEKFADLMNAKAKELGMSDSSFKNPHGLNDDGHYSTARDMATLTAYCMENEIFREIVSTKSYTVDELTYINHNKLLWNYDGCVGVKTGYTMAAGRTLVSCAERNGMRLICVTLGAPDDWNDHMKLYDEAFDKYELTVYDPQYFGADIPTLMPTCKTLRAVPSKRLAVLTQKGDSVDIELCLPRLVFAPPFDGMYAGTLSVSVNGTVCAESDMVYDITQNKNMNTK